MMKVSSKDVEVISRVSTVARKRGSCWRHGTVYYLVRLLYYQGYYFIALFISLNIYLAQCSSAACLL